MLESLKYIIYNAVDCKQHGWINFNHRDGHEPIGTNLLPLQAPIRNEYMFRFLSGLCLQKLQLAKLQQKFLGNPR